MQHLPLKYRYYLETIWTPKIYGKIKLPLNTKASTPMDSLKAILQFPI